MMPHAIAPALRKRQTAKAVGESLLRTVQGQCFELLVREGPGTPLRPVAMLAGSSLHTLGIEDWRRTLSRLAACDRWADTGETDPLLISDSGRLPLLWRRPTGPAQWHSSEDLQQSLAALAPVAMRYRRAMEDLRDRLARTHSIEQWGVLSTERLELVRRVMADVLEWAVASTNVAQRAPAVLLSGSSSRGLGLVSDIDFIPVWTPEAGRGPVGREILERLATGLNACGVKADNVVVLSSGYRLMALSAAGLPGDLAAITASLRLVSGLAATQSGVVVGSRDEREAFVSALAARSWRPESRRWHRRWMGWWTELQRTLREAPEMPYPLLVPLYLRQVTVLREMLEFLPAGGLPSGTHSTLARLRSQFAWLRDVVCLSAPRRAAEPEATYLACVAETMGFAGADDLESHWRACLAELDSQTELIFRMARLSFWCGLFGRTIRRWPVLHPMLRRNEPLTEWLTRRRTMEKSVVLRPWQV